MNLEEALQAVNVLMHDVVTSNVPVLQEASRHIISAGGKRIRPRLLFLSYLACGGPDLGETIRIAAAIELLHTATLVHDDINDNGRTRRGRETINERWGRTFALLTGDFLFTRVYELIAPYNELNLTFAETAVMLVEGEALQTVAARDRKLTRDVYQQIVAKKTASLFRAAAMLGAQLARADEHHVATMGEFGFYVGLAFQIVDDLLDLTGDPQRMGKNAGVDMAQGKGVAAAVIHTGRGGCVSDVSPEATVVAMDEVEAEADDPYLEARRQLIAGGAVEEGRQMVQALTMQAHASLGRIAPGPAVDALHDLVRLVAERDR